MSRNIAEGFNCPRCGTTPVLVGEAHPITPEEALGWMFGEGNLGYYYCEKPLG